MLKLEDLMDSNEWTLRNTPTYRTVAPDLVLIGIVHRDFETKPKGKLHRLKHELDSLTHLAFEATERGFDEMKRHKRINYEIFAHNYFKGQKHYLDSGSNRSELLAEHGLGRELHKYFLVFGATKGIIQKQGENLDAKEFFRMLQEYFKSIEMFGTEIHGFKMPEIMDCYKKIFGGLIENDDLYDSCIEAYGCFSSYLGRLRDNRIYQPKIQNMRRNFEGHKGVIFGAYHAEYMFKLLTGQVDENYIKWQDFVNQLGPVPKIGIEYFEQLSKRK